MNQGDILKLYGLGQSSKLNVRDRVLSTIMICLLIIGGIMAFTVWNLELVRMLYKSMPAIISKILIVGGVLCLPGAFVLRRWDRRREYRRPPSRRQIRNDHAMLMGMRPKKVRS